MDKSGGKKFSESYSQLIERTRTCKDQTEEADAHRKLLLLTCQEAANTLDTKSSSCVFERHHHAYTQSTSNGKLFEDKLAKSENKAAEFRSGLRNNKAFSGLLKNTLVKSSSLENEHPSLLRMFNTKSGYVASNKTKEDKKYVNPLCRNKISDVSSSQVTLCSKTLKENTIEASCSRMIKENTIGASCSRMIKENTIGASCSRIARENSFEAPETSNSRGIKGNATDASCSSTIEALYSRVIKENVNEASCSRMGTENSIEASSSRMVKENPIEASRIVIENTFEAARMAKENPIEASRMVKENMFEAARMAKENSIEASRIVIENTFEAARMAIENPIEASRIVKENTFEAARMAKENPNEASRMGTDNTSRMVQENASNSRVMNEDTIEANIRSGEKRFRFEKWKSTSENNPSEKTDVWKISDVCDENIFAVENPNRAKEKYFPAEKRADNRFKFSSEEWSAGKPTHDLIPLKQAEEAKFKKRNKDYEEDDDQTEPKKKYYNKFSRKKNSDDEDEDDPSSYYNKKKRNAELYKNRFKKSGNDEDDDDSNSYNNKKQMYKRRFKKAGEDDEEDEDDPNSYYNKKKRNAEIYKRRFKKVEEEEEQIKKAPVGGFKTAREEFNIQYMKKHGTNAPPINAHNKKRLGLRGPSSKFVSPMIQRTDSDENMRKQENNSEPIDERLKNIDPKMVELIRSEIMDFGPKIDWNDIAGLHFAKNAIQEAVVWPMLRPDIFTGLRRPPKGILLFGPPGTGKTLIGKCVASQSQSTFFSISASSLTSKWIGDGEKMVRALFAVARCHQPAVIFIDEIDSLLSQRSDSEHESSRRIKTEFLVQLDGATTDSEERLLLIGATNRPQELDEAARRRFVKRLYIPLPEFEARLQLVQKLMSKERHSLDEDNLKKISDLSNGYSGADMRNLCADACMGPIRSIDITQIQNIQAQEVRPVSMEDFIKSLNRMRPSVSSKDLDQYLTWDKTYGSSGF